jgi:hypothetical protein
MTNKLCVLKRVSVEHKMLLSFTILCITGLTHMELVKPSEITGELKDNKLESMFALPVFVKAYAFGETTYVYYIRSRNDVLTPVIKRPIISSANISLSCEFLSPPFHPDYSMNRSERGIALCDSVNFMRKNFGCLSVKAVRRPQDPVFLPKCPGSWEFIPKMDFVINLSKPVEEIFRGFHKRHRYSLRKASGLNDSELIMKNWNDRIPHQIQIGCEKRQFSVFSYLWQYTQMKMRGQRGILRSVGARPQLNDSLTPKRVGLLCKEGHASLFSLIDSKGNPLSSAIIFLSGERTYQKQAYWSAGATSPLGLTNNAAVLLQWIIINWLKLNEYELYFMGGISYSSSSQGPRLFKEGFQGKLVQGFEMTFMSPLLRSILQFTKAGYQLIKKM